MPAYTTPSLTSVLSTAISATEAPFPIETYNSTYSSNRQGRIGEKHNGRLSDGTIVIILVIISLVIIFFSIPCQLYRVEQLDKKEAAAAAEAAAENNNSGSTQQPETTATPRNTAAEAYELETINPESSKREEDKKRKNSFTSPQYEILGAAIPELENPFTSPKDENATITAEDQSTLASSEGGKLSTIIEEEEEENPYSSPEDEEPTTTAVESSATNGRQTTDEALPDSHDNPWQLPDPGKVSNFAWDPDFTWVLEEIEW